MQSTLCASTHSSIRHYSHLTCFSPGRGCKLFLPSRLFPSTSSLSPVSPPSHWWTHTPMMSCMQTNAAGHLLACDGLVPYIITWKCFLSVCETPSVRLTWLWLWMSGEIGWGPLCWIGGVAIGRLGNTWNNDLWLDAACFYFKIFYTIE